MKKLFDDKNVHAAFEVSLVLKGAFATVKVIAGMFAYFVAQQFVLDLVKAVTRTELTEDPRDFVANYLLHATQSLSVSSQHFAAFYLLSHGIIKLWLIIGLWRGGGSRTIRLPSRCSACSSSIRCTDTILRSRCCCCSSRYWMASLFG